MKKTLKDMMKEPLGVVRPFETEEQIKEALTKIWERRQKSSSTGIDIMLDTKAKQELFDRLMKEEAKKYFNDENKD